MSEGKKFDDNKNRLDLIPADMLFELGRVLTMGSAKYGDRNWETGINYNRVYGAALRHLLAWWNNENVDSESGISHLAHCICNLTFLLYYEQNGKKYEKFDNRP